MAGQSSSHAAGGIGTQLADLLKHQLRNLVSAVGSRAVGAVEHKVGSVTDRLSEYAEGQGGAGMTAAVTGAKKMAEGSSPAKAAVSGGFAGLKDKVKGMFGGGKGGGKGKKLKVTNIEETLDVGVPLRVAYNQWTQIEDFPSFMKKVESVDKSADEKSNWKAQVFWSHRTWEATVIQQIPDYNIVWRSKGPKGHVDGSVTFHELLPNMTRILLVMEYYPQGLFERTGNLWRAPGRRARLEFKHFRRHVMTQTILDPDGVEGWRGEIRDGEVVKDHDTAMREEEEREQEPAAEADKEPSAEDEPSAEGDADEEPEGDADEEPSAEGDQDEEPSAEGDADEEPSAEDEPEAEAEPEPEQPRRRPVRRARDAPARNERARPQRGEPSTSKSRETGTSKAGQR